MIRKLLLGNTLIVIITGCSSLSVTSDYDLYADFSKYKTFYIYAGELKGSKLETVPLVKKRVLDAIDSELLKKGFTKEDSTKAEMIIFVQANTAEKMNVNSYGYSYGYGWGPYPYGRNIDISYYTQGSLIIDFVDNKKNELIWRGIGTAVLQDRGTPEEKEQFINEAVMKILDQYPPTK
jgi:Domain of unknown function (DUF4136)